MPGPVTVAALFTDPGGPYSAVPGVLTWDRQQSMGYSGPYPVVAHPPCLLWVSQAAVNWKRYQAKRPAWYPGGTDGGGFAYALLNVRRYGGVLHHPGGSHAFRHFGMARPRRAWQRVSDLEWRCEVNQSAYGHKATRRTWLIYVGRAAPKTLNFDDVKGVSNTLSMCRRNAIPAAFRNMLLELASNCKGCHETAV